MELDPLAMVLKNDEKCKFVARYLHKYPAGRNKEEACKVKQFLNDTTSKRAVLSQRVNKYSNMLKNMEVEEVLNCMHTVDLPFEVKHKIFTQTLWEYATQYYVVYNSCKFVAMDTNLIPYGTTNNAHMIGTLYMPCFLAEIDETLDHPIFFSKIKLDSLTETNAHNDQHNNFSDFDKNNRFYVSLPSELDVFCCIKIRSGGWLSVPIKCTKKILKNLVSFLDIKKLRVLTFKQSFNESVEALSLIPGKESVNKFIELLALYKDLPEEVVAVSTFNRSASQILQGFWRVYRSECNKKPTPCILQHLS